MPASICEPPTCSPGSTAGVLYCVRRRRGTPASIGRLILAAAALLVLTAPRLQSAEDASVRRGALPMNAEPAEVLSQIARIDAELQRLGEPPATSSLPPQMAATVDAPRLYNTEVFTGSGMRYFTCVLRLVNSGSEPMQVPRDSIRLEVDGRFQPLPDSPGELDEQVVVFEPGDDLTLRAAQPPDVIDIPPGKAAAVRLAFAPLESPHDVPRLRLQFALGESAAVLDINRIERGRLELSVERVGPQGCCGVLTIRGAINSVNVRDVADALERFTEQGVSRLVIAWSPDAAPVSSLLGSWLASLRCLEPSLRIAPLPPPPTAFKEVHLAALPVTDVDDFSDSFVLRHAGYGPAVSAALRTAVEGLSRDAVLRELRQGDAAVQAAALRHGAAVFAPEDLPVVLRLVDEGPEERRSAACRALAEFDDPTARAKLLALARSGPEAVAAAAFEALLTGRASAADGVLAVLEEPLNVPETDVIALLAAYPRPEFIPRLETAARKGRGAACALALRALADAKSPKLPELVQATLDSLDPEVEPTVVAILNEATMSLDSPLYDLAVTYGLQRLRFDAGDERARQILYLIRDPRIPPVLAALLRQEDSPHRAWLIESLGEQGGDLAREVLLEIYPRLSGDEAAVALRNLHQLRCPEALQLARVALTPYAPGELTENALEIICRNGANADVDLIEQAAREAGESPIYPLAGALANLGTPRAYDALVRLRDSSSQSRRAHVVWALEEYWRRSPSEELVEMGWYALNDEDPGAASDPTRALRAFQLAVSIDRLNPRVYSLRGHLWLRQGAWSDAEQDFRAALEINPDDHIATTGIAIAWVMTGRVEEGVHWATEASSAFSGNTTFAYNVACVYGRAIVELRKRPESPQRDEQLRDYREQAFRELTSAMDNGFSEPGLMEDDPDLESLHDDPRFADLLRQAQSNNE